MRMIFHADTEFFATLRLLPTVTGFEIGEAQNRAQSRVPHD